VVLLWCSKNMTAIGGKGKNFERFMGEGNRKKVKDPIYFLFNVV